MRSLYRQFQIILIIDRVVGEFSLCRCDRIHSSGEAASFPFGCTLWPAKRGESPPEKLHCSYLLKPGSQQRVFAERSLRKALADRSSSTARKPRREKQVASAFFRLKTATGRWICTVDRHGGIFAPAGSCPRNIRRSSWALKFQPPVTTTGLVKRFAKKFVKRFAEKIAVKESGFLRCKQVEFEGEKIEFEEESREDQFSHMPRRKCRQPRRHFFH